jgi:hypothetical protein
MDTHREEDIDERISKRKPDTVPVPEPEPSRQPEPLPEPEAPIPEADEDQEPGADSQDV